LATVEVTFYSAPGCSLCDEALVQLEPLARELGLTVRVVDISMDSALEAAYRSRIPVAEVGGRVAFKYRLNERRLRRLVAQAQP
jgi:thiol-disulfide isomerase/thioredoxin